jgi:DNA-binding protein YbaB
MYRQAYEVTQSLGVITISSKQLDNQVERYARMREEIAGIRATSTSADRTVTVIAGPAGAVLDIRLTEQAMHAGSAAAVSASIMSAMRLAVADAARQQAQIVQRYVGDRLNIAERVMKTQHELLGDKIEAGDREAERLAAQRAESAETDSVMVTRQVTPPPPAPIRVERAPRQPDVYEDEPYDPFAGRRGR